MLAGTVSADPMMLVDDSPLSSIQIGLVLSGGILSENFGGHELLETFCIKRGLVH